MIDELTQKIPEEHHGLRWVREKAEELEKRLKLSGLAQNLLKRIQDELVQSESFWKAPDVETLERVMAQVAEGVFQQRENWEELADWENAKTGLQDAFGALWQRYNPRIKLWLKPILPRFQDREEVASEIWLLLLKKLNQARGPWLYSYKSWLKTVAKNMAFAWKKEKDNLAVQVSQVGIDHDQEAIDSSADFFDICRYQESIERSEAAQLAVEQKHDVERIKADLDAADQAVLEFEPGETQKEKAKKEKVTQGTISSRKKRVILKIRQQLGIGYGAPKKDAKKASEDAKASKGARKTASGGTKKEQV